jgi:transposase InsO family protein
LKCTVALRRFELNCSCCPGNANFDVKLIVSMDRPALRRHFRALICSTCLRTLTVVDVFSREALAIEAGKCLRTGDVVSTLNRWVTQRRAPHFLFANNCGEFSDRLLDMWAYHYKVQIDFSPPGKSTDNSFIETFNDSFRDKCPNLH